MKKHIKALKIGAFFLATAMIVGLIVLANLFLGNPVSRLMAYNAGKKYIADNLADGGYVIESVNYDWKSGGGYSIRLSSEKQIDGSFYLDTDMLGRITDDMSYYVTDGINTAYRLSSEYDDAVNYVASHTDLPFEVYNVWGRLVFREDIPVEGFPTAFGEDITISSLEANRMYNVEDLGEKIGEISFYFAGDVVLNSDEAAEFLLKFKESCDGFGVKFRCVSMIGSGVHFEELPYEDIYENGLPERIEAADKRLDDYFTELDIRKGLAD